MSNQEHVIEPLSGGVPLFRQIKNNMEVSQLMGLGGQAPSAMKQRRPFSPPIKDHVEGEQKANDRMQAIKLIKIPADDKFSF